MSAFDPDPPPNVKSPFSVVGAVALFVESLIILFAVSVGAFAAQHALRPLYGTVGASSNFSMLILGACMVSSMLPYFSLHYALLGMAISLTAAPFTAYQLGSITARYGDTYYGPLVTHAFISIPSVILGARVFHAWLVLTLAKLIPSAREKTVLSGTRFAAFLTFTGFEWVLWRYLPLQGQVNSCNLLLGSGLFFALLALVSYITSVDPSLPDVKPAEDPVPKPSTKPTPSAPSKKSSSKKAPKASKTSSPPSSSTSSSSSFSFYSLLFGLPFLITSLVLQQTPCSSRPYPYLAAHNTVRILAKDQSLTGTIITAEYLEGPYRFLRCDHSLLGGQFILPSTKAGEEERLGESIYSAFILQEAVRLVKRERKKQEKALVIGLGIGIAANSLNIHSISPTILEIDPKVYEHAVKYFAFPASIQPVYLEDARKWVKEQNITDENNKFDYAIHDVFSGGIVPDHLFTMEFWKLLKAVLKSDGVVAVNFVGEVDSNASRSILITLLNNFSSCRVLHDQPIYEKKDEPLAGTLNMVFFCTSSSTPLTFRSPVSSDYSPPSFQRENIFQTLSEREIPFQSIWANETDSTTPPPKGKGKPEANLKNATILKDEGNPLASMQEAGALEHWKVMRRVLPAAVWEAY